MKTTRTKMRAAPAIQYEPYPNCPFCQGNGCFGCKERKRQDEAAALKAEQDKRRLEDSLMFSARLDNPAEMQTLVEVFHADRLREFYDTSDLTDEDVFRHLGNDDVEQGRSIFAMAFAFAQTRNESFDGFQMQPARVLSEENVRQIAMDKVKQQIAAQRGAARMREALRGKPGASDKI